MSTSVDEFLSYLLGKFDSKIYSNSDECIIVERVRYSSEHCYPINTTRHQIFPDGRIITFVRDDIEGSDFRERNRFHLQHVTIESKETHHIEKLGWDEPSVIETHPIYPFAQVGPISAFIAEGDKNLPDIPHGDQKWCVRINGGYQGYGCSHSTKEDAIRGINSILFSKWNDCRIARDQIEIALKNNDVYMALTLAEGIGYAKGCTDSQAKFKRALAQANKILERHC